MFERARLNWFHAGVHSTLIAEAGLTKREADTLCDAYPERMRAMWQLKLPYHMAAAALLDYAHVEMQRAMHDAGTLIR